MATRAIGGSATLDWRQLGVLLGARLIINTAFRLIYPLLALLAAGFSVTLQTASLLATVQVAATLLSPLGGRLADVRGERTGMAAGLGLFALGAAVCAVATAFWLFLAGYALIGLSVALFMPAVQTYASNRSDYRQRGRVLGFLELSWALAALVGVVGLTQLVALTGGWGVAFGVLAGGGLLMLLLVLTLDGTRGGASGQRDAGMAAALRAPSVVPVLLFVAVQMWAVELIFVSYAAWLEQDFAASTQQLGLVFGLLGIAELGGSVGATLLTDRIGKRRSVLLGFLGMGLFATLLPFAAGQWWLFLALFLLFGLCFEFGIVSVFPLVSGLGAGARGTVLALAVAASGTGRIAGSLVGPRLFEGIGFLANGLLAGLLVGAGLLLGVALLREGQE
jgi:predicted MFS family arabinose efflux permease